MPVCEAVDAPRMHHQWFPDMVKIEGGKQVKDLPDELRTMGHHVTSSYQGDAHTIWIDPKTGKYHGAADKRIDGKAAGY
jgi:gamma-glutamyltranspeptidase/glutathione hydrolase